MNKGTVVFSSAFWRDGIRESFVIKDINSNFIFELNRYQLMPC